MTETYKTKSLDIIERQRAFHRQAVKSKCLGRKCKPSLGLTRSLWKTKKRTPDKTQPRNAEHQLSDITRRTWAGGLRPIRPSIVSTTVGRSRNQQRKYTFAFHRNTDVHKCGEVRVEKPDEKRRKAFVTNLGSNQRRAQKNDSEFTPPVCRMSVSPSTDACTRKDNKWTDVSYQDSLSPLQFQPPGLLRLILLLLLRQIPPLR